MSCDTCPHGAKSFHRHDDEFCNPIHVLLSRYIYPSTVFVSPSTTDSDLNEKKCRCSRRSLATSYIETSDEIVALKEAKRHVKNELKSTRDELDGLKLHDMKASDRTLLKADKRTAIQKLEHQLSRARRSLEELDREKERTFRKREEKKRKMVEMVARGWRRHGAAAVAVRGVEDMAAIAKVMEWVRMDPESEVEGGAASTKELEEIKEAASRFNVKMELGENGDRAIA